MGNGILIIGSDSNIAGHFINAFQREIKITGIARNQTAYSNEIVCEDFEKIDAGLFSEHDTVLNFAAIVHRPGLKDSGLYGKVNHKLTVNNARKAKEAGVDLFVQISTISVYGGREVIDIHTPENPGDLYGISKLQADRELLELQDNHFKVAIVRPPLVYGGGYAPGNMLRLIKLLDRGIPLPYRKIRTKRDYIHVSNLIQYLYIICTDKLSGTFLLCDGESKSTEDIFSAIVKYLGRKNIRFPAPLVLISILKKIHPGVFEKLYGTLEVKSNFPLEGKIRKHTFDSGIREMVNWYLEHKNKS